MAKRRKRSRAIANTAAFASLLALSTPAGAHVPIKKLTLTDQTTKVIDRWQPNEHRGFWGKGTLRSHQPYAYDQRYWNGHHWVNGRYFWGTR